MRQEVRPRKPINQVCILTRVLFPGNLLCMVTAVVKAAGKSAPTPFPSVFLWADGASPGSGYFDQKTCLPGSLAGSVKVLL